MSTTTGARLAFLSGLSGVSAQQHLRQIAGFYGVAAAMLVAFSGYPSAPAWVHLYPPAETESAIGGARSDDFDNVGPSRKKRPEAQQAAELVAAQPSLSDVERRILDASLQAFLASSDMADTADGRLAIRRFVDATVERMARADLQRRASTEQLVDDFAAAAEQQRVDNRRRAIILTILLLMQ